MKHLKSLAVTAGQNSHCQKSKRGVVLWWPGSGEYVLGWNHQPSGFTCDGSDECRKACNKVCVHAEEHAILQTIGLWNHGLQGAEMLHVKVVNGQGVPSGPPSCWQCSRMIVEVGISRFWLLHDDGFKSYTPKEFHQITLQNCSLPVIK